MSFFLFPPHRALPALILFSLVVCTAAAGFSKESSEPIHIEADRMVSQEQKNSVVFIGNVDASQGKVTIRADEMTVAGHASP